jgi:hypothetical protein
MPKTYGLAVFGQFRQVLAHQGVQRGPAVEAAPLVEGGDVGEADDDRFSVLGSGFSVIGSGEEERWEDLLETVAAAGTKDEINGGIVEGGGEVGEAFGGCAGKTAVGPIGMRGNRHPVAVLPESFGRAVNQFGRNRTRWGDDMDSFRNQRL